MSSGQILITLGALILLSITVLNVNRNFGQIDTSLTQSKCKLEAMSLMSSYIEQASQYPFDEAMTDTTSGKDLADFVQNKDLGFDADDAGVIDDFDDYDGQVIADTGRSGVIYNVLFDVSYSKLVAGKMVKETVSKTYHKKMAIYVYDNYDPPLIYQEKGGYKVKDTLKVEFTHSFWFYN
jgi:hypothetical protein